jgi:hypothetical protein
MTRDEAFVAADRTADCRVRERRYLYPTACDFPSSSFMIRNYFIYRIRNAYETKLYIIQIFNSGAGPCKFWLSIHLINQKISRGSGIWRNAPAVSETLICARPRPSLLKRDKQILLHPRPDRPHEGSGIISATATPVS